MQLHRVETRIYVLTVPKDLLQQSNYIKCNIHIYRFTKTLLNKKIKMYSNLRLYNTLRDNWFIWSHWLDSYQSTKTAR